MRATAAPGSAAAAAAPGWTRTWGAAATARAPRAWLPRAPWFPALWHLRTAWFWVGGAGSEAAAVAAEEAVEAAVEEEGERERRRAASVAASAVDCGPGLGARSASGAAGGWGGTWRGKEGGT